MKTDDHDNTSDDLRKQAWVWLRLLHSGEVKAWDLERFERWVRADPAHRQAFQDARQQWEAFTPLASEAMHREPDLVATQERGRQARLYSRRAFLGAAVGTAAVAGIVVMNPPGGLWPAPGEWGADYRTAKGEQREIDLVGDTRVTLNTQTSIRRRNDSSIADGIDLLAGEAAVDLSASPDARPFVVAAGPGFARAEHGSFQVRYLDNQACVTCEEGQVRVEHPSGQHMLTAHQQTTYDDRALGAVTSINPRQASAWRKGELVFDNTRLADAIAEINRYRPGRVVLMNASAADRSVSGSFYIASLDEALALLQRSFSLDSRALPGGLLVLS